MSLRPQLLAADCEPDELRRGLSLGLLAMLISVWLHLIFFSAWQRLDQNALERFVFTLEAPEMEITLTLAEDFSVAEAGGAALDEASAAPVEEPPVEAVASPEVLPEEAAPDPEAAIVEALSPEDQALLEELARAELLPAEEEVPINPDPPLVAEAVAPTHKRYETAVRGAIGRLWIMTPEAINNFRPGRLVVNATLGRDGSLLRFVIMESSGSAALDHIGLEALRGAAPFPPFPEDMARFSQWDITLIFDYQAKYTSKPAQ